MEQVLPWLGWLLAIAGGAGTFLGTVKKSTSQEWRSVAEARQEKIEVHESQIRDLESRLSNLEGKYAALEGLQVDRIADRVAAVLIESGVTR